MAAEFVSLIRSGPRYPSRDAAVFSECAASVVAGHRAHHRLDALAGHLDRLDVQPRPRQPAVPDAADDHARHVEPGPPPAPLAPLDVAHRVRAYELGTEVLDAFEDRRPVLAHLAGA